MVFNMSDVIKIVTDAANQVQWFVFSDIIINARNVEDITCVENGISFTHVSSDEQTIPVLEPQKTFQALQEIIAGKNKGNT